MKAKKTKLLKKYLKPVVKRCKYSYTIRYGNIFSKRKRDNVFGSLYTQRTEKIFMPYSLPDFYTNLSQQDKKWYSLLKTP